MTKRVVVSVKGGEVDIVSSSVSGLRGDDDAAVALDRGCEVSGLAL